MTTIQNHHQMNTTLEILRAAALLALATVAVFGIFCSPADDSPTWYADLITARVIGALCVILFMAVRRTRPEDTPEP